MASVNLTVTTREGAGKGVARKLRAAGRVPGILYGFGTGPRSISLDHKALEQALGTVAGIRAVLQLQVEGDDKPIAALIKDLQRHPLSRSITHVDLLSIDLEQPVDVLVPIKAVGTAIGVRQEGGNLEWQRRELELRVLPTAIPEHIEIDVSEMHLNDALHIEDVQLEGAELLEEEKLTICSVKTTRMSIPVDETEEEAEGEEGAEGEGAEATEGEADGGEAEGGESES
jgi:large subunit ribosomal protein L25